MRADGNFVRDFVVSEVSPGLKSNCFKVTSSLASLSLPKMNLLLFGKEKVTLPAAIYKQAEENLINN